MSVALFNPAEMGTGNYGVRSPVLEKKSPSHKFKTPSRRKTLRTPSRPQKVKKFRSVKKSPTKTVKKKRVSPTPNPDLDTAVVTNPQPVKNLGKMKDEIPKWRVNPNTGVDYFWYRNKADRERNTRGFEDAMNPPIKKKTEKEKEEFIAKYNPDEDTDLPGIAFGGKKRRTKKRRKQ